MRNTLAFAAALAAAGLADASNQGCTGTASESGGNWYCSAVKSLTYTNLGSAGSYNKVTSMDQSSGSCASTPFAYSGSLAPFDEEVSLHFRGPLTLKQFAVYTPGSSGSKAKRSPTARRHAHGHAHLHDKKAVGDIVHAVIDGQEVSWINTYTGEPAAAAPAAAAPAAPAAGSSSAAAAAAPVKAAAAVAKAPASAAGAASSAFTPTSSGDWVRDAYYDSASGTAQGVTFLNHNGGQGSGVFDMVFGNSLSYSSADGTTGASSPQVLADTTIPSNSEVIIMSDKSCSDGTCGYSRDGTVAYHGFGGAEKIFMFEFGMPSDGTTGFNADMPALWMLNAQIPRTMQYGQADCSCWTTGCGEFDLFEVLDSGNTKCKSTIHANIAGGASDYFDRPTTGTIKAAVVMSAEQATIKILDSSYSFSTSMTNSDVSSLGSNSDNSLTGLLADLATSLFTLGSS